MGKGGGGPRWNFREGNRWAVFLWVEGGAAVAEWRRRRRQIRGRRVGGGKGERKTDVGSADGTHVTSNYLSNGA